MNLSNTSGGVGGDFFKHTMSQTGGFGQVLVIVVWILAEFVVAPLFAGMISFKLNGSFSYRTLIDKLRAYFYSLYFFYILTGFHTIGLRAFTNLPKGLCVFNYVEMHSLGVTGCVVALEIQILRYCYTCVWKNVGALNDELISRFLFILNSGFCVSCSALILYFESYQDFYVAVCQGIDPEIYTKETRRVAIPSILFGSILLAITINIAIHVRSRRLNRVGLAGDKQHKRQVKTMFGASKIMLTMLLVVLVVCVVPTLYVRRLVSKGRTSEIPPWLFSLAYISPFIPSLLVMPVAHYLHDPNLRRHASRSIAETTLGRLVDKLAWRIKRQSSVHPVQ